MNKYLSPARGRGEADLFGQFAGRQAGIGLQQAHDFPIDMIEVHTFCL